VSFKDEISTATANSPLTSEKMRKKGGPDVIPSLSPLHILIPTNESTMNKDPPVLMLRTPSDFILSGRNMVDIEGDGSDATSPADARLEEEGSASAQERKGRVDTPQSTDEVSNDGIFYDVEGEEGANRSYNRTVKGEVSENTRYIYIYMYTYVYI
jgi:hypothetical protein